MPNHDYEELEERIRLIGQDLKQGGFRYTSAARECVLAIEHAFQELFHRDLTKLDPEDRISAQDAEQKMGKGQKGVKDFTMGQLIGLFRESKFLESWSRTTKTDLSGISVTNFGEVNNYRNDIVHKNLRATAIDAVFLLNCLLIVHGTFNPSKPDKSDDTSESGPVAPGIDPAQCVELVDGALRELIRRDFTKLDDKARFKVQNAEREIDKDKKGINNFSNDEILELLSKSGFVKSWAEATQAESKSILMINFAELNRFGKKLIDDGVDAKPSDIEFLISCCLVILDVLGMEKPDKFGEKYDSIIKSSEIRRRRKHMVLACVVAVFVLAGVASFFVYNEFFNIKRFDALAKAEGKRFFVLARDLLEKSGPPALFDKNKLPPAFSKNPDIDYTGCLILGNGGNIIGGMSFSHKRSQNVFPINADGTFGGIETRIPGEPAIIYDLKAKSEAENFYASLISCIQKQNGHATYDNNKPPSGHSGNSEIRRQGLFVSDDGSVTGNMTFSHQKSATIFKLESDGAIRAVNIDNQAEPLTGIEFVWIPGGCHEMGCSEEDKDCFPSETPAHVVCVDGFWMGKCEVTQNQWLKIMSENPSIFHDNDTYPVDNVSWRDTMDFIRIFNEKNKAAGNFRLPTEAEWSHACSFIGKAGQSGPCPASANAPHEAGKCGPEGPGLFEMRDNVLEWCRDAFDSDAYRKHRLNNPIFEGEDNFGVARGGSWSSPYDPCMHRFKYKRDERSPELGFRIVWEK